MNYLIVSTAVIDKISHPNSEKNTINIGGAGYYALAGARIWDIDSFISCGKGKDFNKVLEPIFTMDKIDSSAMFEINLNTPTTLVKYDEIGERVETPVYGSEHYQKFVSNISEIEKHVKDIKGLYVFKEADNEDFFKELEKLKLKYNFKILWEISSDTAIKSNINLIKKYSKFIDVFSINKSECKTLFECEDKDFIENLKALDFDLIFYRQGSKGASLISRKQCEFVPSVDKFKLVDPTGAGNSSSAAILVGYCNNKSLCEIGMMGSISAGYVISQNGAPLLSDGVIRKEAKQILIDEIKKVKNVRQ